MYKSSTLLLLKNKTDLTLFTLSAIYIKHLTGFLVRMHTPILKSFQGCVKAINV